MSRILTQYNMETVKEVLVKLPEVKNPVWLDVKVKTFQPNGLLESVVVVNYINNNDLEEIPARKIKEAR